MFSEPVVGETFFGRQEVLDLLSKRVSALRDGYRQNVALTGQSLAGKSSIIHHFLYTMQHDEIIPVYVEVVREPFVSFAHKFIATLLHNALAKLGEGTDGSLTDILERSQKALPRTHAAAKRILASVDRGLSDDSYGELLGLTSIVKDEARRPCLVILDEFDNLEHLGIKNPFLNFGKVIMVQKDTMYIVSSSRNEAINKILSEKLSLLFGNFEIVKVSGFDAATANAFLDAKLSGYDIEPAVKRFLIAFADGNAFYLDKLARRSREIALDRMSNYIDIHTVAEAASDLIYNAGGVIHQYLLTVILDLFDTRHKDTYLAILIAIANGRTKQPEIARALKAKPSEVAQHLGRLMELGVLSKNGVFYRYEDAMLRFWLRYVYQQRKETLVGGIFTRAETFRRTMEQYIDEVCRESLRHPALRLAELFHCFANDLVRIDTRSARLPHFTRVEVEHFSEDRPYIAASLRGKYWIGAVYVRGVGENDIIEYVKDMKRSGHAIANKVIIPLAGMDENAKLLAKELKIAIWDSATVNALLTLYGKHAIVIL